MNDSRPTESFAATLSSHGLSLRRRAMRSLQLNLGDRCDLSCAHCHVDAGPERTDEMSASTADRVVAWIERHRPPTVDLTGGAPELCGQFRRLAAAARAAGAETIVRTNLTVLLAPASQDLPGVFARLGLRVVASLPCYLEANVDAQRGRGVFARSIAALRRLNAVGYGTSPELPLDLMYNPGGASPPPDQPTLEADYRRELSARHGVVFRRLLCLANLPVGRFARALEARGESLAYAAALRAAFNPRTVDALMCRDTLNVGPDGTLYDCDFHQAAGIPLGGSSPRRLWDVDPAALGDAAVATAAHCFGCTAGPGSSCGGALV